MQTVKIDDRLTAQLHAISADTRLPVSRSMDICFKRVALAYLGTGGTKNL